MTNLQAVRRAVLGLALTTSLAGCETFGNPIAAITGDRATPDEFQVLVRKPLRMPGTLDLPEPRLGERSPLEPDPQADAEVALLGAPAFTTPARGASAGERALLSAANASAESRDLALELEQTEAALEKNKPYEAPSLFYSVDEDAVDAIAPAAESRRLQTEGVGSTPVDPNSVPLEGRAASDGVQLYYDPVGKRPDNRLPNASTTTAF